MKRRPIKHLIEILDHLPWTRSSEGIEFIHVREVHAPGIWQQLFWLSKQNPAAESREFYIEPYMYWMDTSKGKIHRQEMIPEPMSSMNINKFVDNMVNCVLAQDGVYIGSIMDLFHTANVVRLIFDPMIDTIRMNINGVLYSFEEHTCFEEELERRVRLASGAAGLQIIPFCAERTVLPCYQPVSIRKK